MAGMSTINLDLHFASCAGLHSSRVNTAQIYVKGMYGDGISRLCVNIRELDTEITRLQREPVALRSKGRSHFAKSQAA